MDTKIVIACVAVICFVIVYCAVCLNNRLVGLIKLMLINNGSISEINARFKKLETTVGGMADDINDITETIMEKNEEE